MGNLCFKGSSNENEYLSYSNNNQGMNNNTPVDREVLAAAAEKRLQENSKRGIKTNTVAQRAKADLPEFGEATMKWQVG